MIILDTNAVHDLDPHGSRADLIRMLRKVGLPIAIPWVVLEELTAHKLYEYQRHFELMLRNHKALSGLEPNLSGQAPKFEGEEFASYWRKQYSEVFETIPTKESALKAAVLREAACMKPAKMDKSKKSGGRDVAVWFSILDYLDEHPESEIHFVTNNIADFGEPETWPFPLDIDLTGKTHRVKQLLDFEEVLKEFTEKAEPPQHIEEKLTARLNSVESNTILRAEVWRALAKNYAYRAGRNIPPGVLVRVALDSMRPVECRRIGESVWFCAAVKWQVYMIQNGLDDPFIATWDTSILFPEDEGADISVLRRGRLAELSVEGLMGSMSDGLMEDMLSFNQHPTGVHEAPISQQMQQEMLPGEYPQRRNVRAVRNYRTRLDNPLFYSQSVCAALTRTVGPVEYTDGPGDYGVDATVSIAEGNIAVVMKAGHRQFFVDDLRAAYGIPRERGDGVIIVTSRPLSRSVIRHLREMSDIESRPLEIVQWIDPSDDDELEAAFSSVRDRLANG
ncbi:PIN domain-containing protein [Streptomyces vinaceus]|uniref:PIN domain-containing protein n=1 Tax=Streptomyces vinaceus TaxID=1960 RepID=UPI00369C9058